MNALATRAPLCAAGAAAPRRGRVAAAAATPAFRPSVPFAAPAARLRRAGASRPLTTCQAVTTPGLELNIGARRPPRCAQRLIGRR